MNAKENRESRGNVLEVTFKHVTLTYPNGSEVLHDMDFEIPSGQLIALLGPSGGGKSTTLNLISGLLQPTSGDVLFGRENVTKQDALQRGVGMVFQNYALYPHMTVLENIMFPMKMAKMPKAKRRQKAIDLAKLVRVESQISKKPAALSGGQQQRVAIARALAKEPNLLLLDEPLSNLDARLRVEMRQEIRRIQQETGVTTIFVTHDQSEAMHIADQIMVLNDGVIQQFAPAQTLYTDPTNQFVASFIGEPALNLIPAQTLADALPAVFGQAAKSVQTLGIRPEAFALQPTDDPFLQARVEVVQEQHFGREQQVQLRLNDQLLEVTDLGPVLALNRPLMTYIKLPYLYGFDERGKRIYPHFNEVPAYDE